MTRALRIDVAAGDLAVVVLVSALAQTPADPWSAGDLLAPEALAKTLREGKPPMILYVGFPSLYKSSHIPGAILAGPGSKPEGIEALKAALAVVPRDNEIVLYCGCCPWDHCPNVRPAFKLVRELGFKQAKLVTIPTNLHTDWITKGYPIERLAEQKPKP